MKYVKKSLLRLALLGLVLNASCIDSSLVKGTPVNHSPIQKKKSSRVSSIKAFGVPISTALQSKKWMTLLVAVIGCCSVAGLYALTGESEHVADVSTRSPKVSPANKNKPTVIDPSMTTPTSVKKKPELPPRVKKNGNSTQKHETPEIPDIGEFLAFKDKKNSKSVLKDHKKVEDLSESQQEVERKNNLADAYRNQLNEAAAFILRVITDELSKKGFNKFTRINNQLQRYNGKEEVHANIRNVFGINGGFGKFGQNEIDQIRTRVTPDAESGRIHVIDQAVNEYRESLDAHQTQKEKERNQSIIGSKSLRDIMSHVKTETESPDEDKTSSDDEWE